MQIQCVSPRQGRGGEEGEGKGKDSEPATATPHSVQPPRFPCFANLLCIDDIRVTALHLGQETSQSGTREAATKEYCRERRSRLTRQLQTGQEKVMRDGYELHKTAGVPIFFVSSLNASAEMIAPAFPDAALRPCAEARKRVGKTSAG